MAFGKPGRPTEDRLLRQREIYQAVAPLILKAGAHYLSMRAAAREACMSIGGLYHYFPTKRELVLHGIQPEAIARYCQEFHDSYAYLAEIDPAAFLDAYLDFLTFSIGFIRPAFHAAIELGVAPEDFLEPMLAAANEEFVLRFRATFPDVSEDDAYQAGRAVHRTIIAALLDKSMTAQEFRKQVTTLMNGYSILEQAVSPVAV
jgi:AcrR family transcriptional regulator